jgi:predicted nucleotidyltransferase
MKPVDIIFSEVQQRILAQLMLNPDDTRSTNHLIDAAHKGRGATQRALDEMVESGLLIDIRLGNQRRFKANTEFMFFEEVRSICIKSFGLADVIKEALWPLRDEIDLAFVFGSIATGKDHQGSDIDLFMVGKADLFMVNDLLESAENRLGRPVHVNLYDQQEWKRLQVNDSVVQNIIQSPKIPVMGDVPNV